MGRNFQSTSCRPTQHVVRAQGSGFDLDRNKPGARCGRSSARARTFRMAASPPEQSGITELMFAREGQQREPAVALLPEDRRNFFRSPMSPDRTDMR